MSAHLIPFRTFTPQDGISFNRKVIPISYTTNGSITKKRLYPNFQKFSNFPASATHNWAFTEFRQFRNEHTTNAEEYPGIIINNYGAIPSAPLGHLPWGSIVEWNNYYTLNPADIPDDYLPAQKLYSHTDGVSTEIPDDPEARGYLRHWYPEAATGIANYEMMRGDYIVTLRGQDEAYVTTEDWFKLFFSYRNTENTETMIEVPRICRIIAHWTVGNLHYVTWHISTGDDNIANGTITRSLIVPSDNGVNGIRLGLKKASVPHSVLFQVYAYSQELMFAYQN